MNAAKGNVRNLVTVLLLAIKVSPGSCLEHNGKIPRSARNDICEGVEMTEKKIMTQSQRGQGDFIILEVKSL
jgi:hypothetical protein